MLFFEVLFNFSDDKNVYFSQIYGFWDPYSMKEIKNLERAFW